MLVKLLAKLPVTQPLVAQPLVAQAFAVCRIISRVAVMGQAEASVAAQPVSAPGRELFAQE
jgi:hypothetical protein